MRLVLGKLQDQFTRKAGRNPGAAAPLQGDSPCRPPNLAPTSPAVESGRGSPLLRQAAEAARIISCLLPEERWGKGAQGTFSPSMQHPAQLPHTAYPLCLCCRGSFGPCPSVLLSLVSCLSVRLCPSVQSCLFVCHHHPLSFSICLFVRLRHPSSSACPSSVCSSRPSVHLTLKWMGLSTGQQADVVPALSEPLSWPGGGKGLGSVMVAEGAFKAPLPSPSAPSSTQPPREPQSPLQIASNK